MSMGLQEVHPSVVHMPLAFAPLAIGADFAGVAANDPSLRAFGRASIALAAATGAVAAVTGLVAQEEVHAEGAAHDALVTHRTLNIVGGALLAGMALWRRNNEPGPGYLALGAGLLGGLFYSAYLGGKMVYHHGVGVVPAGGVAEDVPELTWGEAGAVARAAAADVRDGAVHTARDLREGRIAPALRRNGREAAPEDPAAGAEDGAAVAAPFEQHPPIH